MSIIIKMIQTEGFYFSIWGKEWCHYRERMLHDGLFEDPLSLRMILY